MSNGILAELFGYTLPLQVLRSHAGFYLGTMDEEGPVSRESEQYWATEEKAKNAMETGDWTQRQHP